MTVLTGERKAGFSATGHAFRILSSTLYSDKVLAAVRESLNNARDAQIMVGKDDQPFFVHLPNRQEPFWAVRDYGPGLSDEEIGTVYTTYFLSTKARHSDKFAGQLGLGTKAPLAYKDNFTVVSFFNGTKSTYTIFFDENSEPTISPALAEPTDEPNGLEVRIDVDAADFAEFHGKTEEALTFFNPMPTIVGGKINPSRPKAIVTGSNYIIDSEAGGARALMGVTAYPIDTDSITGLHYELAQYLNLPILIDVPLGTLDFVPSREGLSYDKVKTIPGLTQIAKNIRKDLPSALSKQFVKCEREIDARRRYRVLIGNQSFRKAAAIEGGVQWKGLKINSPYMTVDLAQFPGLTVHTIGKERGRGRKRTPDVLTYIGRPVEIDPDGEIYSNDRKRGAITMVCREVGFRQQATYVIDGTPEVRDAFIKFLGGMVVYPVSDLEPTPRAKRERSKVSVRQIYSYRATDLLSKYSSTETTVDFANGGFYAATIRGEYDGPRSNNSWSEAVKLSKEAGLFDPETQPIFVVPATMSKKFKDAVNWQDAYYALKAKAQAWLKQQDLIPLAKLRAAREVELDTHDRVAMGMMFKGLPETHALRVFAASVDPQSTENHQLILIQKLASAFDIELVMPTLEYNAVAEWDRLKEKYPLLETIIGGRTFRYSDDEVKAVIAGRNRDYIKMVDSYQRRVISWSEEEKSIALALKHGGMTYSKIAAKLTVDFGRDITKSHIVNLFNREMKGL